MKAVDTNLLELLKKAECFIVPIYQRVYSWGTDECAQLWTDILRAGNRERLSNHFTGSIVYIESGQGTNTSREPDLIIDGQQRVTTVTLLLAALVEHLRALPPEQQEPVAGFAPEKIRGQFLTNPYNSSDAHFKLTLTQRDKDALKAVVQGTPLPETDSRVITNYRYFVEQLTHNSENLAAVCRGLDKLVVVDVKLTRGADDPQLVFESMNATGKRLSQADLIRNFVLMDLESAEQIRLYEAFWHPMEQRFKGQNEHRFDEFVRHYLTLKTNKIPRIDDIYEAFKSYAYSFDESPSSREDLVTDLAQNAKWFAAMALGAEPRASLATRFDDIDQLATVAYPFQLQLYADFVAGQLSETEFTRILDAEIAYLFRRAICRIPTNSLNKTFATLAASIDRNNYATSVCARLLNLPDYRRFPTDEEFADALTTSDMYHTPRRGYLFRKLENVGRKESVSTAEYTIEHIMPQNANAAWREALGPDWQTIHDRYLHTLGNLTLTGYNPEYSDRPFSEKQSIVGGFKDSPLRLNEGLGQLAGWGPADIEKRAQHLATMAVQLWPRPQITERELALYKHQADANRFDWSLTHSIIESIPAGHWTSYFNLAEAVGTGAQAIASHLSKCTECRLAYRVLTWDGRVAPDFHWQDPDDVRNPIDLLTQEGLVIANGKADPERQLTVQDLLTLVVEDGL